MLNPINTAQKIKSEIEKEQEWVDNNQEDENWQIFCCKLGQLKATLTAKKEEWENEMRILEKMDNIWAEEVFRNPIADRLHTIISNRYAELQKAVQIANG